MRCQRAQKKRNNERWIGDRCERDREIEGSFQGDAVHDRKQCGIIFVCTGIS